LLLLLSLINFLKNTIIIIEEKPNFFKKRIKNIRILVDKFNRLETLGFGIAARPNTFGLIVFVYFL
jgi:hypothetical protein